MKMETISLKLPGEMLDVIDGYIAEECLGYESRDEFIREGIRCMMERMGGI